MRYRNTILTGLFTLIVLILLSIKVSYIIQEKSFERRMLEAKNNNASNVYLMIMDSADPDIIDYLIENDQLPNFKKLKEEGAYGRLESFSMPHYHPEHGTYYRIYSLPVIATMFTGVGPDKHGMVSHIFNEEGPDSYYAFTEMGVPALWNYFDEYDKSSIVVGTLGNYPVDYIFGYIISGEYIKKQIALRSLDSINLKYSLDFAFPDSEILSPSWLKGDIQEKIVPEKKATENFFDRGFEEDFPDTTEKYYIDKNKEVLEKLPNRLQLEFATKILEDNETAFYVFYDDLNTMTLSSQLYKKYKPGLFIEYLVGLDYFSNLYHTYEYTNYSDLNSSLFKYYYFYDEHIGEVINSMRNNDILIIVSDHGALELQSIEGYRFGNHRKLYGIVYLYGGDIRPHTILNASVYNIAPSVLYYANMSLKEEMYEPII